MFNLLYSKNTVVGREEVKSKKEMEEKKKRKPSPSMMTEGNKVAAYS